MSKTVTTTTQLGYYDCSFAVTHGEGELDMECEATFDVAGRYAAATLYEPAEYPEVDVCTVHAFIGPSLGAELNRVDMYDELRELAQAECEEVDTREWC